MTGRSSTRRELLADTAAPVFTGATLAFLAKGADPRGDAVQSRPGVVDVRDHGAVGDGVADDAPAIAAAIAAASRSGASVFFPKTETSYGIASPLLLNASLAGDGAAIKALDGLSGGALLKSDAASRLRVRGLTWDADLLPDVQIWGRPDVYGSFGHQFDQCLFKNTAPGVYSLGENMTASGNGYTVGTTFRNCVWQNCAQALDLRNVQDDITFVGCRFFFEAGNRATDYQMRLGGQNLLFQGSWYHVADTDFLAGALRPLIEIGSFPVTFRHTFFEVGDESANCSHLFELANASSSFGLEDTTARLRGSMPNLVSLVRSYVEGAVIRHMVTTSRIRRVSAPDDTSDYTVMDIGYPGGGSAEKLTWTFDGLDDYEAIGQFGSEAVVESVPAGFVDGVHRGRQLRGEVMSRYGVMSPDPERIVGGPGEPTFASGWMSLDPTNRPVTFRRHEGRVRLQGLASKEGEAPVEGETIFGLPLGYRPQAQKMFEVTTGPTTGGGRISVESTGEVRWVAGEAPDATDAFLDQVEFPAEQ